MCIAIYTCFLGLTRVHTPNGSSISSAVFFRAHDRDRQTDRQTHHATPSVTKGRTCVRGTAMRPNSKASGECSVCHAVRQLHLKDGTVCQNGPRNNRCPGSGKPPAVSYLPPQRSTTSTTPSSGTEASQSHPTQSCRRNIKQHQQSTSGHPP